MELLGVSGREVRRLSDVDREYLMQFLVHEFIKSFYDVEHYRHLRCEDYLAIRELYVALLRDMGDERLSHDAIEERHCERIRVLLQKIIPAARTVGRIADAPSRSAAAMEYSAQFQIDLLGLDMASLQEPLLDIGCGEHGYLVEHLRENGLRAYGIDRGQRDESFYICADWLEFDYGRDKWGTIVCNLSFSSHFITHFLQGDAVAGTYARAYLNILHSLAPGGSWIYAPSAPFMEDLLSEEEEPFCAARRVPISDAFTRTVIAKRR